jgi:hypothetical protein
VFDCDVLADNFRLQMDQNQRLTVEEMQMSTALWGDLTYMAVYNKIDEL